MTKKRILFVGEGVTLSHVIRPLFLATHLRKENYDITFACDKRYRPMVENTGLTWYNLSSMSPEEFNKKLSSGDPVYSYGQLKEYIADEKELFATLKPDIIVGDFRISLGISSPIEQIPYVCLANAYWSPFATHKEFPLPELQIIKILGPKIAKPIFQTFFPMFSLLHCNGFNRLSHENKLPPIKSLREMYSQGTWTLYTDTPQLVPTQNLPSNHFYLGPICELPNMSQPAWWENLPKNKPIIYLSLGSSGEISILRLIKDVLKAMEVSVIFATSGRVNSNSLPNNFFATDYVSGLEVAKIAQLFITNGGSGSIYQGLSYGVPILGFPTNMDQFFVMEQIQSLEAGKLIRPSLATTTTISQSIHELLTQRSYQQSAQNLANEIKQFDPANRFKNFIDSIFNN